MSTSGNWRQLGNTNTPTQPAMPPSSLIEHWRADGEVTRSHAGQWRDFLEQNLDTIPQAAEVLEEAASRDENYGAQVTDAQILYALGCLLRRPNLASLLLIRQGGDSRRGMTTMPAALEQNGKWVYSVVWAVAAQFYDNNGRLPDRETLSVASTTAVGQSWIADVIDQGELCDCLDYFHSDRFDEIDDDAARGSICDVINHYLYFLPVTTVYADWRRDGWLDKDKVEAAEQVRDKLAAVRDGTQVRLRGFSIVELRAEARPPQWHARGLIVRDETLFVAGPMKALKSGVALDLAISLALPATWGNGARFLDHFTCEPARHVLLFSVESGQWPTLNRIDQIVASKPAGLPVGSRHNQTSEANPADRLNLTCYFDPPRLSLKEDQIIVRREIRNHRAEVVIFDPFYLVALSGTDVEAANVFQMGETIRAIENVCKREGATPIFVHHFTKSLRVGATPTLQNMAFSGSGEVAAQWILLNHRREFDPTTGHCRLWMYAGGRVGQGGRWGVDIIEGCLQDDFTGRHWSVSVLSVDEARDADRHFCPQSVGRQGGPGASEIAQRLVRYLGTLTQVEEICMTPLAERTHMRPAVCREGVNWLIENGQAERVIINRNNREHEGFRLTEAGWLAAQREPVGGSGEEVGG